MQCRTTSFQTEVWLNKIFRKDKSGTDKKRLGITALQHDVINEFPSPFLFPYLFSNIKTKSSHFKFQLCPAQLALRLIDLLGVGKFLEKKHIFGCLKFYGVP